jgi:hypothetical protein
VMRSPRHVRHPAPKLHKDCVALRFLPCRVPASRNDESIGAGAVEGRSKSNALSFLLLRQPIPTCTPNSLVL